MRNDDREGTGASQVGVFDKSSSSPKSKLWTLLFWVSALFLLYKGYQWVEAYKANTAAEKSARAIPGRIPNPTKRTDTPPETGAPPNSASQVRAMPSLPDPANTRHVTKCVLNGAVSYSDGVCPNGAKDSIVTLDVSKMGTVAPQVRPVEHKQASYASPAVVAQYNAPTLKSAPVVNFECVQLKARIEQIDSATRQPLAIQQQEWYKEERRKVRQRETDLKC